ncbi:MAG TPA: serine hydrolase domain-containing protein [Ktedonobacteraceae bacterium]|nr:serine hydrolase domain-containing protein [Ktedonobacteraceae bacterium]
MISKKELALVFEQLGKEHSFNGAILVSQGREVLFEKAYGFASRQLNVPNVLETKFHIASVTKMFIAMAALILYEQGLIELHEKPAAYVPAMAALDKDITLHHLLSHTSGLQDIYDVPNLRFEMNKLKNEQGNLLSYLVKQPQLFRPGEGWSYSSTGFILMGYLMEKVTGASFAELMKRSVLTPLSMTNTGHDLPRRINPGRAYGHAVENGQLVNADNDRLSMFEEAPGELYSTVYDLKKWCDAMFDCPLVSSQTLKLMFTPYGQVDPSLQYGYGWFLTPRFRVHGGGTPGFISRIRQYPEQHVSIILLFNSDHVNPETIFSTVEPHIVG